jgi:hypothetical protein
MDALSAQGNLSEARPASPAYILRATTNSVAPGLVIHSSYDDGAVNRRIKLNEPDQIGVGGSIPMSRPGSISVSAVPAPYKSTARILLDTSVNRYLQTNKIADEIAYEEVAIASQVYILSSESITVPVVRSMNLAHDLEFVDPPRDTQYLGYIDKLKKSSSNLSVGMVAPMLQSIPMPLSNGPLFEALLKNLSVVRGDVANVIDVTFTSKNPNKAANIANAVADTYIAADLGARLKLTKTVSQWLQNRLLELKVQALDADRALQNYKITNNLLSAGKSLLGSQQLSDLNTQLTNARIARTAGPSGARRWKAIDVLCPSRSLVIWSSLDIVNYQSTNFEQPASARQRQYEALRAFFLEDLASAEVARRFGYTPAACRMLCYDFRRDQLPDFGPGAIYCRTTPVVRDHTPRTWFC